MRTFLANLKNAKMIDKSYILREYDFRSMSDDEVSEPVTSLLDTDQGSIYAEDWEGFSRSNTRQSRGELKEGPGKTLPQSIHEGRGQKMVF